MPVHQHWRKPLPALVAVSVNRNQIYACSCPFWLTRGAIAPFKQGVRCINRVPGGIHIQQVDEEICGQGTWALGKDTVRCLPGIDVQYAQPPSSTVISGAVRVSNCALSTSNASGLMLYCVSDSCGNHRQWVQGRLRRRHRFAPERHPYALE